MGHWPNLSLRRKTGDTGRMKEKVLRYVESKTYKHGIFVHSASAWTGIKEQSLLFYALVSKYMHTSVPSLHTHERTPVYDQICT